VVTLFDTGPQLLFLLYSTVLYLLYSTVLAVLCCIDTTVHCTSTFAPWGSLPPPHLGHSFGHLGADLKCSWSKARY